MSSASKANTDWQVASESPRAKVVTWITSSSSSAISATTQRTSSTFKTRFANSIIAGFSASPGGFDADVLLSTLMFLHYHFPFCQTTHQEAPYRSVCNFGAPYVTRLRSGSEAILWRIIPANGTRKL